MTYRAALTNGSQTYQELPVSTPDDIDELLTVLDRDEVHTVTVRDGEEDPAMDVQVHGGYGYLLYAGEELLAYSVGDPASPALTDRSESAFPAGSGVPLETLRAALREFVETGGSVPSSVSWQEATVD
ncbi:Imm1 family immunity protein [Saccharomonospora amisosensis]|uniref:Imm1 family immunity protein n=1 Tax=Saccharomonospora amisosensis TaxID=1128677 RepID=UPI001FBBAD42|nr:Imm1 family immunity protein [Saccharomonospora amisosensis]